MIQNVILHLKCKMEDLNTNIENNLESYTFPENKQYDLNYQFINSELQASNDYEWSINNLNKIINKNNASSENSDSDVDADISSNIDTYANIEVAAKNDQKKNLKKFKNSKKFIKFYEMCMEKD